MLSIRNRELFGLLPSAVLVVAGFLAVLAQRDNETSAAPTHVSLNSVSHVSLSYGLLFLGLCVATHVAIRLTLPLADPYLLPLVAVLASAGIVMVYRINPVLARQQAEWMLVGLVVFVICVACLKRGGLAALERYRYTIAVFGIGATILPRLPGIGQEVNGAYLDIHLGSISFQPAEFTKIAIVIFLASYLRDNRQILVMAGHRILGLTIPPMKQFGPMLLIWGAAMGTLLVTRELGTSLMFYGAFLALLYVATARVSFPLIGLALFAFGAWYIAGHVAHVHSRVLAWEHPLDPALFKNGTSYQLAQSMFAQADGGLLGTGFGRSLLLYPVEIAPHHIVRRSILPVPESDMIYAVLTNELGLAGASALLTAYFLLVARGLKIAVIARDSFSKLLATGLSFIIALQVFVIVGGVTDVIPLTGVTLPFVSYGGSSIVANFVLVAMLLVVSDRNQRGRGANIRSRSA